MDHRLVTGLDQYAEGFKIGRWDGYWHTPKPHVDPDEYGKGYHAGYDAGWKEIARLTTNLPPKAE